MNWAEFAADLAKSIQTAFNEVKDSIEKADNKDELIKTFKDTFTERISNEYKDSTKIEDIKAFVDLAVDELSSGIELNIEEMSSLLEHKMIKTFTDAFWLIREAIIFKDYI